VFLKCREKTNLLKEKTVKQVVWSLFLKEPLALSDEGKNVHEKLLRLVRLLVSRGKILFRKGKK
jgi:hypothetical protein